MRIYKLAQKHGIYDNSSEKAERILNTQSLLSTSENSPIAIKRDQDVSIKLEDFTHMFMVMDLGEMDFKQMFNTVPDTILDEEDIVTILYNQLCSLNFLHSAGIMHRNVSPSNFLIDKWSTVMICDFGSARTKPSICQNERDLRHTRKQLYSKSKEVPRL